MLSSPGALLRGWRLRTGWTQDEVADALIVSRAAVTRWENDTRQIPTDALTRLDGVYGARGCLVDLMRAINSPQGHVVAGKPTPRRRWGHVLLDEPGPVWMWVRPAEGDRVTGFSHTGLLGVRFDEVTGPGGLFITRAHANEYLPTQIELAEPGWVDFGRGEIPHWLGHPTKTTAQLADVEIVNTSHPTIDFYLRAVRARDRGDPETLRDRLRDLVGHSVWDGFEEQVRRPADRPGPFSLGAPTDPRPPSSAAERIALLQQLRRARGLSQTEAADAVNELLAGSGQQELAHVTRQQVRNCEEGRASRTRHLPALLDMVYDGFGWGCWEPVATPPYSDGAFVAGLPPWWVGPVSIVVSPESRAERGQIVLTSRFRCSELPLPELAAGEQAAFEHLRLPDEPPLSLRLPPGWDARVFMGHTAGAVNADRMWTPNPQAEDWLFDLSIDAWARLLGLTRADFDRALQIE